ncbi:hypothetical protein [Saccharothrix syringae]|uniref:Uncharacterized protein n=1 Tax=Saccharothrix syringae TaxID=103733 RepID=A0A5Q0GVU3_SACSY|nr:hypothetical protein [Saccharothrix syringae]QFZ18187.1 hypothetical protein EKG83_12455 [Saccharothrix syringae]
MTGVLATALIVVALVGAAWSLALTVADKPITLATKATLGLAGVVVLLELGLLVQLVVGVLDVLDVESKPAGVDFNGFTFVGYLIGAAILLPGGAFWALAERTRWGAGVLTAVCLGVAVMVVRLNQLWPVHA